jgi:hypothetical protein
MSLNISISDINDFPSLEKKTTGNKTRRLRSSSALSSQSSASAGSRSPSESVTREIPNGDYFVSSDRAVLRPHLRCFCRTCQRQWLREEEWTMSCKKARSVAKKTIVRVLQSKVVHHKVGREHEQFSVALAELQDPLCPNDLLRGWVLSKTLLPANVRSESAHAADGSRSRSGSVTTSVQEPEFQFGELVLVQMQGGEWLDAEVKNESPLQVMLKGCRHSYLVHPDFVKKNPTRRFRLTQDLPVRSTEEKIDDSTIATLKKGTVVSITHMAGESGYEGHVVAPVCGWVTMRSKHSLNLVNEDWEFAEQKPTIVVQNLPPSITEEKLVRDLYWKGYCQAEKIEFQRRGNEFRALVQVRYEPGFQLVDRETFDLSCRSTVSVKWSVAYLQNRAAANLC